MPRPTMGVVPTTPPRLQQRAAVGRRQFFARALWSRVQCGTNEFDWQVTALAALFHGTYLPTNSVPPSRYCRELVTPTARQTLADPKRHPTTANVSTTSTLRLRLFTTHGFVSHQNTPPSPPSLVDVRPASLRPRASPFPPRDSPAILNCSNLFSTLAAESGRFQASTSTSLAAAMAPKRPQRSTRSHRSTLSLQKTEIIINVYDLLAVLALTAASPLVPAAVRKLTSGYRS